MLVIGCGAGVTAGAVSIDPMVERVTIAEIEPLVPRVVSTYFGEQNHHVVDNPKVRIRIDDARHFLLTTKEKFDAHHVGSARSVGEGRGDAVHAGVLRGGASAHLNPGGVVTLFVQLYESSPEAVKSEMATFFDVFPNGIIAGNTFHGIGYDTVLIGQAGADAHRSRRDRARGCTQPTYAPGGAHRSDEIGAASRRSICSRPTRAGPPI